MAPQRIQLGADPGAKQASAPGRRHLPGVGASEASAWRTRVRSLNLLGAGAWHTMVRRVIPPRAQLPLSDTCHARIHAARARERPRRMRLHEPLEPQVDQCRDSCILLTA
ncbi:hypothetical protein SEVIR_3G116101v4 [Setaria viridis]